MNQDLIPSSLTDLYNNMVAGFSSELQELVELVVTPGWRQYQLVIILFLWALAFLLKVLTQPRWDAWTRARTGWPKWRLRTMVQLMQRLTLVYFVLLSGSCIRLCSMSPAVAQLSHWDHCNPGNCVAGDCTGREACPQPDAATDIQVGNVGLCNACCVESDG